MVYEQGLRFEQGGDSKDTSKGDTARQETPPSGGNEEPSHGECSISLSLLMSRDT